jgi:Flp pilus assembly protein TadG
MMHGGSRRSIDRASARPLTANSQSERGQALAELAIVITIMLVMALAVFDLGRAYYMSMLLNQAARDGARVAMKCDATVGQIQTAALAATPTGSSVTVSPNPRPACPPTMSTTTQTTVTVTYTHNWITPFWGGTTSVAMSEAARSR